MITLKYAPDAFKGLNGFVCIYKPVDCSITAFRRTLCFNLCRDLNKLSPKETSNRVSLEGSVLSKKPFQVQLSPNIAEHRLVSGPHYQPQDLRMKCFSSLGSHSSGVVLMALNDGCKLLHEGFGHSFLRKYILKGKFGLATDSLFASGKVVRRSSFNHVKESSCEKVLAAIVAYHQSLIYDYLGIDIQSQAAYDMASKGLLKISANTKPILLNIKCIDFKLPNFTLELQCVNETEDFLAELIHNIGIELKTSAVCTELHRVQFGQFLPCHALLRKHWSLANILNNLALCNAMLDSSLSAINQNFIEGMQHKVREEYIS